MMKRLKRYAVFAVVALTVLATFVGTGAAAQPETERTPLQGIDRVESLIYGKPLSGGLLLRLAKLEQDLFGMELPGSLTERQIALQKFVEEGTETQPSLIFKMGVAEWMTLRRANSTVPFADRVEALETTLEGTTQEGALSARLERLLTKILPGGVTTTPIMIPAGTVIKASFVDTLTVRTVARGDTVVLQVEEDCIVDGTLAIAKGNRVYAEITKVSMPKSFGRASEIKVDFVDAETIGGSLIPVLIGPEAEKAMQIDSGTAGAAGASLAGVIIAGPAGLLGGFLVRGNDKQIPAGSLVYVETEENAHVVGYLAPNPFATPAGGGETTAPATSETPPAGDTESTGW